MGDSDDRARVGREMLLEPEHSRRGGSSARQQQRIRGADEGLQRDSAALTTGEDRHGLVRRRAAQGVHRLIEAESMPHALAASISVCSLPISSMRRRSRRRHLFRISLKRGELAEDISGTIERCVLDKRSSSRTGFLHEDADRVTRG